MPAKASSDFGLYKEKQKENNLKSVKFVLVVIATVFFLLVVSTQLIREPIELLRSNFLDIICIGAANR
jgi:hypothetical protein